MPEAIIRLATPEDCDQIAAIYAPYVTETAISFEIEPPGAGELARRIGETLAGYPWLVCERDGEILGYAYAMGHRTRWAYQWSVDTAIYVDGGRRRAGVGRALYTALLAALPLQGFFSAYAGVTLPNAASVGLHQAMGFEPVGVYRAVGYKLGRWHDVGWYQRTLQAGEPAGPPLPIEAVRALPAFQSALELGARSVRL
jgi:phosphinothricin acetyltransferase